MPTKDQERIFCKYCKDEILNKKEQLQQAHNSCLQAVEKYEKRDKVIKKQLKEIFGEYFQFESYEKMKDRFNARNLILFESDEENNIIKLRLHNCDIEEIPSLIGLLHNLKILIISYDWEDHDQGIGEYKGHKIKTLPKEIDQCKNLESFMLEYCPDFSFPINFGNLKNLKQFETHDNLSNSLLPDFFSNLLNLEILELGGDDLVYLPESIGKLKKLKSFSAKVTLLPESFGELVSLQKLDIRVVPSLDDKINSDFKPIPDSFENLKNLRQMFLKIDFLPEIIGRLTNLSDLTLLNPTITTFPNLLCRLINLKRLVLFTKNLTSFSSITSLDKLEYLDIQQAQLDSFPNEIGKLKNLKVLKVFNRPTHSNVKLLKLPDSIGDLTSLTYLTLYQINFESIPETIGRCSNLKRIGIQSNELKALPKSLVNCKKLEILDIDHNKIVRDEEFNFIRETLINNGCEVWG